MGLPRDFPSSVALRLHQNDGGVSALFERAIGALMRDSQLLYFAYADFEEERMKYEKVKTIYDRLLAIDTADPTLVRCIEH